LDGKATLSGESHPFLDKPADSDADESESDSSSDSDDEESIKIPNPRNVIDPHKEMLHTILPSVDDMDPPYPVAKKSTQPDEDESDNDLSSGSDDEDEDVAKTTGPKNTSFHEEPSDAIPSVVDDVIPSHPYTQPDEDESDDASNTESDDEGVITGAKNTSESSHDDPPDTISAEVDDINPIYPSFGKFKQPKDGESDDNDASFDKPALLDDDESENNSSSRTDDEDGTKISDPKNTSEISHHNNSFDDSNPTYSTLGESEQAEEVGSDNNNTSLEKPTQSDDDESDNGSISDSYGKGSAKINDPMHANEFSPEESSGNISSEVGEDPEQDDSTNESGFNSIDEGSAKITDQKVSSDQDSSGSSMPMVDENRTQPDGLDSSHSLEDEESDAESSSGFRDKTGLDLIDPTQGSDNSHEKMPITNAHEVEGVLYLSRTPQQSSPPAPPVVEGKTQRKKNELIDLSDSVLAGQGTTDFEESHSRGENEASHRDDGSSYYGSCNSQTKSDNSLSNRKDRYDDQPSNDQSLPENHFQPEFDEIDYFHDTNIKSDTLSLSGDDKSSYNSCRSQHEDSGSSVSQANVSVKDSHVVDRPTSEETKGSSNAASKANDGSSSPRNKSLSSREILLSIEEMDELNELLDREENGEIVDEGRIYELDLLSRWQIGETLEDEELVDLYKLKAKRKKRGGPDQISGGRGHSIEPRNETHFGDKEESQMKDPRETMIQESVSPESPLILESTPLPEHQKEMEESTTNAALLDNMRAAEIEKKILAEEIEAMKERERSNMMAERKRLDEKKRMLANEEKLSKLAKEKKLEEETRMAQEMELIMALESKKNQEERRRRQEESRLIEERLKMEAEQRKLEKEILLTEEQMKIDAKRKQLAKEARLAEEKILAKQKVRMKLEKEAQLAEEERRSKEKMRMKLEKEGRKARNASYSVEMKKAAEDTKRRVSELEATKQILATAALSGELEAPSFEETSNSSSSDDISLGRESHLSLWEMDELDELLNREEKGETVNEDRIYELDLFSRYQLGDELDQDEMADLDDFRMRRRNNRHGASPSLPRREKQKSKGKRSGNRTPLSSSSSSSSSSRSRKGDKDELKRGEVFDSEVGHRRLESGSTYSSSDQNSVLIGEHSENDSKSFVGSNMPVQGTERRTSKKEILQQKPTKGDQSRSPLSSSRSERRHNVQLCKEKNESIPPGSTKPRNLRQKHEDLESASRGSSKSERFNSNDRIVGSIKFDSPRSSTEKQDSNSLRSSGRSSSQSVQRKSKNRKVSEKRMISHQKNELDKIQKDTASVSKQKIRREQQVPSERPRSSGVIEKAFQNLKAWDSLNRGSSRNPPRATNETFALDDVEKGNSSWMPALDWSPFEYIKQRQPEYEFLSNKPDPPVVDLFRQKTESQEPRPIGGSIYINRTTDDSSDASNWGPPSGLKKEKNRKISYVDRKHQFEIHSDTSSSPREYGGQSAYKKGTIQPHPYSTQQIPFVVQSAKPADKSVTRDSKAKSDVEKFKGFDPDLLLSSWGLPSIGKVSGEYPSRDKDVIPRNTNTRGAISESVGSISEEIQSRNSSSTTSRTGSLIDERPIPTMNSSNYASSYAASLTKESLHASSATSSQAASQRKDPTMPLVNQTYSTSSITSYGASPTEEERMQAQDGSDEFSSDFIAVVDSIGESSHETSDFDLERGIHKNADRRTASEFSRTTSEDGSNYRSRNSDSVEISIASGQNSGDQAADSTYVDSLVEQSEAQKSRRSFVCFIILGIVLLALIAGGLTTLFLFLKKNNADEPTTTVINLQPSPPPVPSPTPLVPTPLPTPSPVVANPNAKPSSNEPSPGPQATVPTPNPINENGDDNIIIDDNSVYNLIVANVPDEGASLNDPSSPQSAALSWLQGPENVGLADSRLLQRYALATIYYATNPDNNNWITTSLWLSDRNECDWYTKTDESSDVYTTNDSGDGSVYEVLDLRENGLKGTIPEEISLLTALKEIRLSKNSLTGTIFPFLATLTSLEYLDLSSNELIAVGNEITFMNEIQNMQSLVHLDLFENSFQTTIPSEIWGDGSPLSSTLKVLNLGSNQFYGTLPTEIGFLTKLTGLSVFDNDLSGQLPASISQMPLELLYADSNKFASTLQAPGVPQEICDALQPEPLKEFWADCDDMSCSCCTYCCTEEMGCTAV